MIHVNYSELISKTAHYLELADAGEIIHFSGLINTNTISRRSDRLSEVFYLREALKLTEFPA